MSWEVTCDLNRKVKVAEDRSACRTSRGGGRVARFDKTREGAQTYLGELVSVTHDVITFTFNVARRAAARAESHRAEET